MRAKVLVVPVYQKHWLYHAWGEATAAEAAAAERAVPWTQGSSWEEKATLLGKELGDKMSGATQRQWKSLQAADEGTFKHRLYGLAQWVLSQEDPTETFFKSLPRHASSLEIIHPSTLKERLVRRRLRRMALVREHYHNRRILGWALATLPQLPLMITPFPNVTLYFTAYKMMSHYQALQGCRVLRSAFERSDAVSRELASAQPQSGRGGLLRLLSLPRLRCGGGGNGGGGATRGAESGSAASSPQGREPLPEFRSSRALDRVVRPLDRWQSPLTDEMALRVLDIFHPQQTLTAAGSGAGGGAGGVEALPELVSRLRRQVQQRTER